MTSLLSQSLPKLAGITAAAVGLTIASSNALAFPAPLPDPFTAQEVSLQATPLGSLIELPGIGPGGVSLFTDEVLIDNFVINQTTPDTNRYSADFHVDFLTDTGAPTGESADLQTPGDAPGIGGVTGHFEVQFVGRTNAFQTGTFDMVLLDATFAGSDTTGQFLEVSLLPLLTGSGSLPQGRVEIVQNGPADYEITYLEQFQIESGFTVDGGPVQTVEPLVDANSLPPTAVPLPATAALLIPGFLGMLTLRRRSTGATA